PQLELNPGGEGEGALGPDQEVRHVVWRVTRHQRIEVVAAHPTLHFRKSLRDLVSLALAQFEHVAEQTRPTLIRRVTGEIASDLAEMKLRAVCQRRIH